MRIRSLLSLMFRLALALTATLLIAMSVLIARSADENRDAGILAKIRITLLERLILRSEIYIYYTDRAVNQVYERSSQLEKLLAELGKNKTGEAEASILGEFVRENASINSLFSKLVTFMQNSLPRQVTSDTWGTYEKLLFNQILFKAYVLSDNAQRLESINRARLDVINRGIAWLYASTLFVLLSMIVLSYFMIARKLANGIELLGTGMVRIGEGDLDFKLPLNTGDEIADISNGINQMTTSLKLSLVSIKELERRVADRTEELQNSNRELEAFAYSVAHDLRAPLRSIDGFTKILEEEYEQVLDDEGRRLLKIIRTADQNMDALIGALLEITRIGKTTLSLQHVDMRAIATTAFSQCGSPEVLANFEFVVGDIPDALADPLLIERVWVNLLSNAVKYSTPSTVHKIEVDGKEYDDMLVYSVTDCGVGFNELFVDKLFGMFQRLHDARDFQGSGIGLAIVKRVVTRHGGTVWAKGQIGKGASFHFSLPGRAL